MRAPNFLGKNILIQISLLIIFLIVNSTLEPNEIGIAIDSIVASITFVFLFLSILGRKILFKLYINEKQLSKTTLFMDNVIIKNDMITWIEKGKYKGKIFLIIEDYPESNEDLNEIELANRVKAMSKALDIKFPLDIIIKRESINKEEYLSQLIKRAQNLRIVAEADPSNERIKRELSELERLVSRIDRGGEIPFKVLTIISISGEGLSERELEQNLMSKEDVVSRSLSVLGFKIRRLREFEIIDAINTFFHPPSKMNKFWLDSISYCTKTLLSLDLGAFYPYSLNKRPREQFYSKGIFLGTEIDTKKPIFWNIDNSINPHLIVIGPTGVGKTEFLLNLAYNSWLTTGKTTIIFDVKGDYTLRFKKYKLLFKQINPIYTGFGFLNPFYTNVKNRIMQLTNAFSYSFNLTREEGSHIYEILKRSYNYYCFSNDCKEGIQWDTVIRVADDYVKKDPSKMFLKKIVDQVASIDIKGGHWLQKEEQGIVVINMSSISEEELKRFSVYMSLQDVINRYYSYLPDDKLKCTLVLDEAWTIVSQRSFILTPLPLEIIKRGRGFGLSMMLATQNTEDFGNIYNIYLENAGLIVVFNGGNKEFWNRIQKYMKISEYELENETTFLGKGQALIRFLGDPRPLKLQTVTQTITF